jgi:hypothetical protein
MKTRFRTWLLLLFVLATPLTQAGCGYVAAGAVGAAVGAEAADDDDD